MRPIYGCPENFCDSLTTPTATFLKILWDFVPMVPSERALVSSYRPSIHTVPLTALVSRNYKLHFSVGAANPQFWGRGCRRGSGMVPFERSLVSFYTPSIVTFPQSLRVSDILPLLFSSMPRFSHTTSGLPKISPCTSGNRWIAFWLQRAKMLG